jgi:hypothetical protein
VEELAAGAKSCAKEEEVVEGSRRQHAQAAVARCYVEEEEGSSSGLCCAVAKEVPCGLMLVRQVLRWSLVLAKHAHHLFG